MVLDPVIRSTSNAALLEPEGVRAMLALLVPRARILTPNCDELDDIGRRLGISGEVAIVEAILAMGCGAVLVKGGHRDDPRTCRDTLYANGQIRVFDAPRQGFNLRGTGCHLASIVAGEFAKGADIETAVAAANASICARFAQDPRAHAQQ
jgi:hydroxymethylpyrimidine/phosphomethylpyrimidine kinase